MLLSVFYFCGLVTVNFADLQDYMLINNNIQRKLARKYYFVPNFLLIKLDSTDF